MLNLGNCITNLHKRIAAKIMYHLLKTKTVQENLAVKYRLSSRIQQ